eukprot:CAMPEP_0172474940 /NCGR_PEP_ID=MMETSP1065-20121228/69615_1 /TAXON_ID=265537 /ORGANISM="Amphiprora paludosa, Strain CCMP125" /LENGTH=420 /DNA_ID=CAMNT_0013233133 /DNA_START=9 /DNA_END=1271 /DNA_ORIENTATION=-
MATTFSQQAVPPPRPPAPTAAPTGQSFPATAPTAAAAVPQAPPPAQQQQPAPLLQAPISPASVAKRALITTDKDGNQLSAKKLRRLEKNRLSARECRRRKREATENLQRQINVLEGENLRLRLQLQIGEEAEESMTREQTKLTQDINALLQSGASEAEIYAALESFKEKYADYGRDRRSAIEFHLRNVERLLMPTQTTSVVMAAIEGGSQHHEDSEDTKVPVATTTEAVAATMAAPVGDTTLSTETAKIPAAPAANEETPGVSASPSSDSVSTMESTKTLPSNLTNLDPKTLFQLLVTHLEVTPEQAASLKDSRLVAKELDGCLEESLGLVKELRDRLAQTGENLETEFNNVRNILTPTQAAKFLVWVANNGAAMHMLNELWDRIYPNGGGDAASSSSTTTTGATLSRAPSNGGESSDAD